MANLPSDLIFFEPKNVNHLRACCLKLIKEKGEKQSSLATAAHWSEGDFSNWVHGSLKYPRQLTEDRYLPLLHYVASRGGVEEENSDRVFAGISDFLGHPAEETFSRVEDFVGDYAVYRYSYLAPGYVLQGSLKITADHERKALMTTELYRIQSEMLTRIKDQPEKSRLAEERSKVQDLDFPRIGYFFPRSPDSFVMISKKTKKREYEPVEIQTVYFDNIYESTREPELMQGVLSDWHGDRFYTTRIVVQKLEQPLGDEYIKTLDPVDVNDIVNAYLTTRSDEKGAVVSYP